MTIYYVRPTNGLDTNAGTSFGAAFKSTQKALDTVAAGDTIRLCPEAAEAVATQIDIDTTAGTITSPITLEPGNTTDGARDLTLTYTLQATASITSILNYDATFGDYYDVYNVIFDGNSNASHGIYNTADGSSGNQFINCRFTGCTSRGVNHRSGADFYYCEIDNNNVGIGHQGSNRGIFKLYGCNIHDNTSHGWSVNRSNVVKDSVFHNNGGAGVNLESNADGTSIERCTFYNNTSDGISIAGAVGDVYVNIHNCSFVSNGAYGIDNGSLTNVEQVRHYTHNHFHNNTSGTYATSPAITENDVSGDPLFNNTTAGSEDFRIGENSPLLGAGVGGTDIGCMGWDEVSSGGGGGVPQLVGVGNGLIG